MWASRRYPLATLVHNRTLCFRKILEVGEKSLLGQCVVGSRLQNFGNYSVLVLVLLLTASALTASGPRAPWAGSNVDAHATGPANPAALEPHEPIHITGDAGFNASNGVRSGTGIAADPYLI